MFPPFCSGCTRRKNLVSLNLLQSESSETALSCSALEKLLPFSVSLQSPSVQSIFAPLSSLLEVEVESNKASVTEESVTAV